MLLFFYPFSSVLPSLFSLIMLFPLLRRCYLASLTKNSQVIAKFSSQPAFPPSFWNMTAAAFLSLLLKDDRGCNSHWCVSFLSDVSYVTMSWCITYRRIAVSWYLPNIYVGTFQKVSQTEEIGCNNDIFHFYFLSHIQKKCKRLFKYRLRIRIALSWYLPNIILAILFIKFPSLKKFLLMACIARFIFMFLGNIKIVLTSENRWFSLSISQIRWIIIHTKCHPGYTFPKVSQTDAICFNDIYQTFLKSHLVTWSVLTDSASLFPCCWPYLRSVVISLNDEVQNVWTNTYLSRLSQQLPKLSAGIKTALSLPGQVSAPSICAVPQQGRLFVLLLNCFLFSNHPFLPATVPLPFW